MSVSVASSFGSQQINPFVLPIWQRSKLTAEVTIALKGSTTRADGTTCFGFAGTVKLPDCDPICFSSPALAREANAVRAMAFRRAKTIVAAILGGSDDQVTYIITLKKAGLIAKFDVIENILDRGGYNANFSKADALHLWKPLHERYSKGLVQFQEFTGLVRKAPKGFMNLIKLAEQQREEAKQWPFLAFQAVLGDSFDHHDVSNYHGPDDLLRGFAGPH